MISSTIIHTQFTILYFYMVLLDIHRNIQQKAIPPFPRRKTLSNHSSPSVTRSRILQTVTVHDSSTSTWKQTMTGGKNTGNRIGRGQCCWVSFWVVVRSWRRLRWENLLICFELIVCFFDKKVDLLELLLYWMALICNLLSFRTICNFLSSQS